MSGPVDVMEWMRQCAPDEVLAAVAELIKAARPLTSPAHDGSLMAMLTKGLNAHDAASFREAVAHLEAALARVQGGAA